jgi:hypothetical protein
MGNFEIREMAMIDEGKVRNKASLERRLFEEANDEDS